MTTRKKRESRVVDTVPAMEFWWRPPSLSRSRDWIPVGDARGATWMQIGGGYEVVEDREGRVWTVVMP